MKTKSTFIRHLLGLACLLYGLQTHAQKTPTAAMIKQAGQSVQKTNPALQAKGEKLLHEFETKLRFEPSSANQGIKYTTSGSGFTAGFGTDGVWYNQQGKYDSSSKTQHGYAWQVTFANANKNKQPEPARALSFPVHNYKGGSMAKDDGKAYKEIWYRDVYAGTDCRFYGSAKGELEYDFVLQPGADAKKIGLAYNGLQNLQLESDNSVSFYTTAGKQQHGKPYAYQVINGKEQEVAVNYTLNENKELGFAVTGGYDKTKPLVIDPVVLVYGTYIGGNRTSNTGSKGISVQTDAAGTIYIAASFNNNGAMVTTPGAYDATYTNTASANTGDLEISAFTITGTPLFVTYLGGGGQEDLNRMKINAGSLYIVGTTASTDFPTTTGAYSLVGPEDIFVARFNALTGAASFVTVLNSGVTRTPSQNPEIYQPRHYYNVTYPMAFNTAGDLYLYVNQSRPFTGGDGSNDEQYGEIYKFRATTNALVAGFNPLIVSATPVISLGQNGLHPLGLAVNSNDILYAYGQTTMDGLATTPGAIISNNTTGYSKSYYEIYNGASAAKLYSSYYGDFYSGGEGTTIEQTPNTILSNGQAVIADLGHNQPTTDGSNSNTSGNNVNLLSFNAAGNTLLWAKNMGFIYESQSPLPLFAVGNDFVTATYVSDFSVSSNNATGTPGTFLPSRPNAVTGSGNSDTYLFRMDAAGNKVWATYFGFPGTNTLIVNQSMVVSGNEIAFAGSGNVPVTADAAYTQASGNYLAVFNLNTGALVYCTHLPFGIREDEGVSISFDANRISIQSIGEGGTNAVTADALQRTGDVGNFMVINRCTGKIKYLTNLGGAGDRRDRMWDAVNEPSTSIRMVGNKVIMGYPSTSGSDPITSTGYQTVKDASGLLIHSPVIKIFDLAYAQPTANTTTPTTLAACQLGVVGTIFGTEVKNEGMPAISINGRTEAQNGYLFKYQWQSAPSATGPWTDIGGEVSKNYTPSPTNTNTWYRRNAIDDGGCTPIVVSTSNITALTINGNVAPMATAAGTATYICSGTGTTLTASATGGTGPYSYEWYLGDATLPNATTAVYNTPALTQATIFTLKVTDANGCADLDQVTANTLAANAGSDRSICAAGPGVQIGMSPYAGSGVTYAWSPATGLSSATISNPVATPAIATTYTLSVFAPGLLIACTPTSSVTITPVAAPVTANFAGPDVTVCKGTYPVIGEAPEAGFNYTWVQGAFIYENTTSTTTIEYGSLDLPTCPSTYVLTASKDGCSFNDEVTVSVINSDAGPDGCSYSYFGKSYSGCTNATFSWAQTGGAGTGTIINGANSAIAYLSTTGGDAVYTRTTTLNGVSCTDDVVVLNNCGNACPVITVTSKQRCAKAFPGFTIELTYALPLAEYDFVWSSPAGAIFDNPNSNVVTITSTVNTTVRVTATNKLDPSRVCSQVIQINSPAASLPVFTAADVIGCVNVPIQIGAAPVAGYSYQWTPSSGLASATSSNPMATVSQTTQFIGTVTEIGSGCTITDTSTVTVEAVVADAGGDRAVCQSGIITLGTPRIAGYTYSWDPAGAAYQNGTLPTDPQPQVLIAGSIGSSQVYTLTVTNAGGCTAVSSATLTVNVNSDSYLGPNPPAICQGSGTVIGVPAVSGASYSWTPATGLSCTNCAQPFASPTTSTSYSLAVSFNGCTLVSSATVDVNVTQASLPALPNVTSCPSTPTAIGYSPAPTTGFDGTITSWSWSPSTGLDNATIANPTTTASTTTVYTVTANFSTGCKATASMTYTPTVALVNAGSDKSVCVNGSVIIGSPSNAGTVTWSPATGLSCTTCAQPIVSTNGSSPASTVYTASYTVGACTVTDEVTVNVITPVTPDVFGNQSVCGSACTILSTNASTAYSYQWSPTAGVESPNSYSTKICPGGVSTTYTLYLTDLSTGCTGRTNVPITVNPSLAPTLTASDMLICPGNSAQISVSASPAGTYTYSWAPAATLSNPFIANPIATPNGATTYLVTVATAAGCENVAQVNVNGDKKDFGDLDIATWPIASASIQTCDFTADAPSFYNGNNIATTSVWAGDQITSEKTTVGGGNAMASTDTYDDGLSGSASSITPGIPTLMTVYLNANISGKKAYYRMWIDWNNNGNFADDLDAQTGENGKATYSGSAVVTTAGTAAPVDFFVTAPAGANFLYKTRLVVSDQPMADVYRAIGATTIISIANGEVEDYMTLTILPIDLLSFTAAKSNASTVLKWETAPTGNTASFTIQRSADGFHWQDLADVPASARLLYTYYDNSPLLTANYYRLVQTGKDGAKHYGAIRILNFGNKAVIAVYPNPVSKWLTVTGMNAGDRAELLDVNGKRLSLISAAGNSAERLDMGNLAASIYMLKVTSLKGEVTVVKVIKEK